MYEAVARHLPNWTEDTPKDILEGADAPLTTVAIDAERDDVDAEMLASLWQHRELIAQVDAPSQDQVEVMERFIQMWKVRLRDSPERFWRTLSRFRSEVDEQQQAEVRHIQ